MIRLSDQFKNPKTLVKVSGWLLLLLTGQTFMADLRPATAQTSPEPRFFGEPLPTMTPSSLPSVNTPPLILPTASPNRSSNTQNTPLPPELNVNDTNRSITNPSITNPSRPIANLYRVDVVGDSYWLLSQVQDIEPQAFVREGEGVIQAGTFMDRYNAQSRLRALEALGISARITTIEQQAFDGGATNLSNIPNFASAGSITYGSRLVYPETGLDLANRRSVSSGSNPGDSGESRGRSYFVAIPGNAQRLPEMVTELVKIGIAQDLVSQRDAPRGKHVAVGPFKKRGEAERWSNRLRSAGWDARVYFGR
ncbi:MULTISPECIES: hypothetical protein [unclassified Moorena]|uniref:hypothetical protein n=1 Tax=unclassified Moorena TaxID=2683338 RepID=UPI0013BD06F5|nr:MULTISPECIES: hypothetical protein [unclassified Moorena]NEP31243.1 hypothetical protein [Moorena sp. SIO3B2]NEQ07420.1 hypothetical protein [Moorena sp. SIO4E2]NET68714.1 hypothetical protein [Moorena sp. SIO1G6]